MHIGSAAEIEPLGLVFPFYGGFGRQERRWRANGLRTRGVSETRRAGGRVVVDYVSVVL